MFFLITGVCRDMFDYNYPIEPYKCCGEKSTPMKTILVYSVTFLVCTIPCTYYNDIIIHFNFILILIKY